MTGTPTQHHDDHAEWDQRYGSAAQLFSGNPNGALVTEIGGVAAGRALDVGCGEGADAVWLARQGWSVTALDVSQVALDRAASLARDAAVEVEWIHSGLAEASLAPEGYDLVSVHYPALPASTDRRCERALAAAVAPGGILLVVHHALFDHHHDHDGSRGFDPADHVGTADVVAALLAHRWRVEIDTRRPRRVPPGATTPRHVDDIVLRARRRD